MSLKLQLKRNKTPFASKDEAMGKLQEQLSTAQAGEMIIAVYNSAQQYEYVDLGLPNGLLWAKCNVGAATEEEAGLYFQWGDTQGYAAEQIGKEEGQKAFSAEDYKFAAASALTKYNSSDGKTVLDPEDDGVKAYMGGNWRMPTYDDYKELYDNTDVYFVPKEGKEIKAKGKPSYNDDNQYLFEWEKPISDHLPMKGLKFVKRGDTSTYLFFPAAGGANEGALAIVGLHAGAWSSSRSASRMERAWYSYGDSYGCGVFADTRVAGLALRGVRGR